MVVLVIGVGLFFAGVRIVYPFCVEGHLLFEFVLANYIINNT